MKKSNFIYTAPEVDIHEVAAERGFSISGGDVITGTGTTLPGFGAEQDDLVY